MATTNSDVYANQILDAPAKYPVSRFGGRERLIIGGGAVTGADFDANGDLLKLCQLPSNAVVTSIKIGTTAWGDTQDVDLGLFTAEGAVIDADEFAVGISGIGSATGLTEYLSLGLVKSIAVAQLASPLWERAGLASDTGLTYDIVLTQTGTPTDADGTYVFQVRYTID